MALAHGDGRRDSGDRVGVGLVEPGEELAGVRRKRLDVAPVALGVERVEGQRALARAAGPGHDDQPLERQIEVDRFQVVGADAAKADRRRSLSRHALTRHRVQA